MTIDTNGKNITVDNNFIAPGETFTKSGPGTLTLTGQSDFDEAPVRVNGGTLTLAGTASLVSNGADIANNAGDIAAAALTDDTGWTITGEINIGLSGKGTLTLNDNAVLTAARGSLGTDSGINWRAGTGAGTATLRGKSRLELNSLRIGNWGKGTLFINDDARVKDNYAYIGDGAGSAGDVTVAGGRWENTETLTVGGCGKGTLNINGGIVSAASITAGAYAGSNCTLNLRAGGTLETGCIRKFAGTAALNFNGGTIRAKAHSPDGESFFRNFGTGVLDGTGIADGAAALTVDTNGNNITVDNTLEFTPGDTETAIAKTGDGTLTLKIAPELGTGKIRINAGVLALDYDNPTFNGTVINNAAVHIDRQTACNFNGGLENNGLLRLGNGSGAVNLGNLSTDNNAGTISLEINLADRTRSARLVAGRVSGTHTFDIRNCAGADTVTDKNYTFDLIETTDFAPGSRIRLAGDGSLTAGIYRLGIVGDANATLRVLGISEGSRLNR